MATNPQVYLHGADGSVVRISSSQRTGSIGDPSVTESSFVGSIGDLETVYIRSRDQLTDDAPVGGGDYAYDTDTGELLVQQRRRQADLRRERWRLHPRVAARQLRLLRLQRRARPGATAGSFNLYVNGPDGLRFVSPLSANDGPLFVGSGGAPTASFTTASARPLRHEARLPVARELVRP